LRLAPAFICTANVEPRDGGTAIVDGNRKVLAARLSDAKFFWEQDLRIPLEEQAKKLDQIVFHEKLGTVADKVERVAKLARWLCEEGIVRAPAKEGAQKGEVQGDSGLLLSQEHAGDIQGIPQTGEEDPFVMAEDLRDAIMGHEKTLSYTPAPEESSLIAALDSAEPRARAAVAAEDFEGAMAALATLRAPVDAFFEKVTVNDPDPAKRAARLNLLARMRDAVHQVADFSRIEG
jgi:glycyl-tRNA synthetase beta subunit